MLCLVVYNDGTYLVYLRLAIDFSFTCVIQKAKMMFKSLNGLAPLYLQDLFSERHTDYDLRDSFPGGGGGTPYNGLYGVAPPERSTFLGLQVSERVGISQVEVYKYKRVGKSVVSQSELNLETTLLVCLTFFR